MAELTPDATHPERLRVLIAGGGTGGHVIPALAIAHELVAQYNAEVRFIGTARGMETRLVPAAGFPLDLVQVGQLNSVSFGTRVRTVARLPVGLLTCMRLLRNFRPHAVLGVGGYASGPAMLAAILTGIPRVAFEPNAVPGMANRWIGRRVQAAAVNFAATARYFHNATVTGIPVRPEFFSLAPREPDASPHLLVFGGSQGARMLNTAMPQIVAPLLQAIPRLTILHQCGAKHLESTQLAYEQSGASSACWRVREFLDDMPQQIGAASLVLCRSGASTVAELAAAARPSLLVPFPQAADDHQRHNAEMLVQAKAAEMLLQANLTPKNLLDRLTALLGSPERLAAMGRQARTLAHPDAALQIARMLKKLQPA
ncbi:MAG TPA: undecaprenyldiphospho-muramoylpentapeptide beta-N-acetylglucosaminyltransferase [Acidobacteriaceae bacterium]|jgi:UDP-N-acetylglucosamine--N-acetylmuramyl-(pentapeptide) pyrophosphoryl-undecaprenol N-acetylglucosamine transferase|nr:undecaprenyldiphospho-muramoylpentapeptide beta-N-acetylglucosaminyltransferase [Acidobacteriaceae bacterium]